MSRLHTRCNASRALKNNSSTPNLILSVFYTQILIPIRAPILASILASTLSLLEKYTNKDL